MQDRRTQVKETLSTLHSKIVNNSASGGEALATAKPAAAAKVLL
jgi:hypothetical protein